MLVKDLQRIRELSLRNEDKNWRFRSFLKMKDIKKIDNIVKPIYEFVIANINCLECGNCCRFLRPQLTKTDIEKLSKKLKLSNKETQETYVEIDEFNDLRLKGIPCIFLQGNECQIYEYRPTDCRSFPHLHKKGFTTRLFGIIDNVSICPIVFNVFEELKIKLNFR